MKRRILTRNILLFVVLFFTNLCAVGYYVFHTNVRAPELKVLHSLPVKEAASKLIFEKFWKIQKKNFIESKTIAMGTEKSKNKPNKSHSKEESREFPRTKDIQAKIHKLFRPVTDDVNVATTTTTTANKTVYLCVKMQAGLGNRLYMYASAYGLARSKGMTLVITEGMGSLEATFNVTGTYETDPKLCQHTKRIRESACCKLAPNILNLPNDTSVQISGFFQSYRYFEEFHDELRHALTFRDIVIKRAKAKLQRLLLKGYIGETGNSTYNRTVVGIHIRGGDYALPQSKRFGYKMATKEYIFKAQDYMRQHFPNVTFVACSNDLKWTRDTFREHTDVIVAPIGPAAVDLAMLTLMNHTIITVGTYGFWAAWLNQHNGTVIYYSDFVRPNTPLYYGFAHPNTDTYYPHWIGL